jgi:uncharacterized membrane protein YphA (DoxX/SURF4 family)
MDMLPLALFVAVPIVLLTSALIFFITRAREEEPGNKPAAKTFAEERSTKLLWAISGLLSVVFIATGFPKVGDAQMVLTSFQKWGYPEATHYIIGAVEFVSAILLLVPSTASIAALTLSGVMVGAAVTHAVHGPFWMIGVNAVLFAGLIWVSLQRASEVNRLAGRDRNPASGERRTAAQLD